MNWKEFFKLDYKKISIIFIFFFISILIWDIFWWVPPKEGGAIGCIHITKCVGGYVVVDNSNLFVILFHPIILILQPIPSVTYLLLNIPYYYIISCLIIFLFNKLKGVIL